MAAYSEPIAQLTLLEPEKFKLPYTPEALIHSRSNIMMTTINPKQVEEWLRKIPFQLSFAVEMDETTEFADIVLPDTHFLEKLDMFPNSQVELIEGGHPVVEPPGVIQK